MMLESTLKWFTLMAVALIATAPLLYILRARGEEEGLEAAEDALMHLREVLERALTLSLIHI